MQLAELTPGLALVGLETDLVCAGVAVSPSAEKVLQVFYKLPDGALKERLLGTAEQEAISLAVTERPWAFDGDGAAFQLACEAKRLDLAFLFDTLLEVHTSNVERLPQQINAV